MRKSLILSVLMLVGATPVLSQDEAEQPAADANLYVFRDYAEPLVWAPTVKIDGKKLVALGQDQYTAVRIEPGEHKIQLAWPLLSGQRGKEGSITIAEGETLFLEITGKSRVSGVTYGAYSFLLESGLTPRENASAKIAECCEFKPPKL